MHALSHTLPFPAGGALPPAALTLTPSLPIL